MLSTEDLYWTAGFLEGEGSFLALGGEKRASVSPCVSAAQQEAEPLERLQTLFGGYIYGHGGKRPCLMWRLNGRRSIGLMFTLWPLMSARRKTQIEVVITKWKANLTNKEAAQIGVHKGWITRRSRDPDGKWKIKLSQTMKNGGAAKCWTTRRQMAAFH